MNSHKTAITRNKPSVPTRYLTEKGLLTGEVLDYGCGKGKDAESYGFSKYDPYYAPEMPTGKFDNIVCNYVLNVIDESEAAQVLANIKSLLKVGGVAYITVRRDIKKEGVTSRGTYQRTVHLDLPIVKETSSYCIYKLEV